LSGKTNDFDSPSLPFLFIVVLSNESAIYLLPMPWSRGSRTSRKNVCDRELSGNFDVASVSKIHFNVIFQRQPRTTKKIFHVPQTPLLRRARASSGVGATSWQSVSTTNKLASSRVNLW
jgi:hypothetical protein